MATSDEDTCYTFTWKIENINLYTMEKMDTELASPPFKIGITKSTEFQIYLNSGDWSEKNICLRILGSIKDYLCSFPHSELTLLHEDGGVIESYSTSIHLGCTRDLYPGPTLFSNKKVILLFLPQNSLTIRWKIYSIGSGECFFRTVFHQQIFRWNIQKFRTRTIFTKVLQLPSLHFTIKLSKLHRNLSSKIIRVQIIPSNKEVVKFGYCTIAAVDDKDDTIYRYGEVGIMYNIHAPPGCWNTQVMHDKNHQLSFWEAKICTLHEGVCELIKNDTLILHWEFTVAIDESWNERSNALEPDASNSTLQRDLLRLYQDKKFCDATLMTNTESFSVHKNVLCARSPVFCAMFESDTEEGRTGVVHIPDIEPDALSRMLLFLYEDSLGDIPWEMALKLYYAADKYGIQTLKEKCASVLKGKLSVANACEAFVLADNHQDEDLLQAVKDFISDHDQVVCSADWKELEKKNPLLAIQFLREMYLKGKGANL